MTAASQQSGTEITPKAGKGLESGALGLWGNVTIGLASTAPAYSLAATLGYVVLEVTDRAPAMFILAFIPMLLVAIAYRELNRAAPDCGTTFTWGTKAFGPWVGWMGGWGVAVSAIIVLANVAEIAAIYMLRVFGLDALAENPVIKVGLGIVFIAVMTYIAYRGIVISERIQAVLVTFQFVVLIVMAVIALAKVFGGTAGEQAVRPELVWFSPFGLETGAVAQAVILCIFIYWGWDSCLAVTEETKDSDRTPGRAALISTVILLLTYVLVAVAIQSFAGLGDTGIGLGNEENSDDVLTIVGEPVLGVALTTVLLLTVAVSAAASTQTTILPTARGALAMAVYGAIPGRFSSIHPRYKTPGFATIVMGITSVGFYLVLSVISENALADSVASLGLAVAFYYGVTAFACVVYFRRTLFRSARHFFLRGLLPLLGGIGMTWAFVFSAINMADPENSSSAPIGPLGATFVIGVGMLALGVPLMIACAIRLRAFFRGETLNADTPILVPDTGELPSGGL
jgi:amino acid transporter